MRLTLSGCLALSLNLVSRVAVAVDSDLCDSIPVQPLSEIEEALIGDNHAILLPTFKLDLHVLRERANEFDRLSFSICTERCRLLEICADVRALVREQLQPIPQVAWLDNTLGIIAARLESIFKEIKMLSSQDLYRGICMAGLVEVDLWKLVLPKFSSSFIAENSPSIAFAATAIGDSALCGMLQSDDNLEAHAVEAMLMGIAYRGSVKFLKETMNAEFIQANILHILQWALIFDQEAFFLELLPMVIDDRSDSIGEFFVIACSLGSTNAVLTIIQRYRYEISDANLRNGMLRAAAEGGLDVVRLVSWDHMYCRIQEYVTMQHLEEMLFAASKADKVEVIRYLLWELHEPTRKILQRSLSHAIYCAIETGSLRALEVLLGKESQDCKFLIPQATLLGCHSDDLGTPVLAGRMELIRYSWDWIKRDNPSGSLRFQQWDFIMYRNFAVMLASKMGQVEVLRFLLLRQDDGTFVIPGIDPSSQENAPLIMACTHGHLNVVRELLQTDKNNALIYQGIDPAAKDNLPLQQAAVQGHRLIVSFLLQRSIGMDGKFHYHLKGIDPTVRNQAILCEAAMERHTAVVSDLFECPGVTIPLGLLPLVAESGTAKMVKILLEHEIPQRRQQIQLALEIAKESRNLAVSNVLIGQG